MPLLVEPSPCLPAALFGAPDEAQDASYFAASDRTRSFATNLSSNGLLPAESVRPNVHDMFFSFSEQAAVTLHALGPSPCRERHPLRREMPNEAFDRCHRPGPACIAGGRR